MKRLTWTGDITEATQAAGLTLSQFYFNDKILTQRRIKFFASKDNGESEISDGDLVIMQDVIQKRRPHLLVNVSRHDGTSGNVVVKYRPRIGKYLRE